MTSVENTIKNGNRDASITEEFGDGEYKFRLGWKEWIELQEQTGVGPFALFRRLTNDNWKIKDISEVIRIALIGGGLTPKEAGSLIRNYVVNRPPMENHTLAQAIVLCGVFGAPKEEKNDKQVTTDDDDLIDTDELYGAGGAVGFNPQEVDAMSMYQFATAVNGIVESRSGGSGKMSKKDEDQVFALVMEDMAKDNGSDILNGY